MCSGRGDTPSGCRVSPFGHPRIEARSAAPRDLSQPPTSFFGFRRQGIHRWLFVAWRTKMLVLAMQFSTCGDASGPPEIHTAGITRKSVDTLLENGTEGPNDTAGARAGGE